MWLFNTVLIGLCLLLAKGQNLEEEEGLRCYDCNSFNPHCREQVNQSDPTQGFAVFTRCPITQRCFIRKDKDGVIVRGCADGWRFSLIDIEYMGCKEQSVDWLGPQVWCFCDEDLCNQVPMGQLNRGQYTGLAQSSEYFSVDSDLHVEHELTGWLGPELLEKHLAEENKMNISSSVKTTTLTTKVKTTRKTTTKSTPKPTTKSTPMPTKTKTTITQSTSAPSTTIPANETTELTNSTISMIGNNTTDDLKITNATIKLDPKSNSTANSTDNTSTNLITTVKILKNKNATVSTKSTSKPTSKVTFHSTFRADIQSNATKKINNSKTSKGISKDDLNSTKSIYTTSTIRTTTNNASEVTDMRNETKSTKVLQQEEHVDLPWWLWHVVSTTPQPTTTTTEAKTTPSTSTVAKVRPTTRRSYLKPKVILVSKRPNNRREKSGLNRPSTTPSSESERWTWSPSWWDKWWRPGTRRPRKPKRPAVPKKHTRKPLPTQGRGHYWWLAPVGPTVQPPKHRVPSTKFMKTPTTTTQKPYTTKNKQTHETRKSTNVKHTNRQTTSSTRELTKSKTKARVTYPQHFIATSTPAPVREYPKYPQWGKRIINKSIYPIRTTKRRLPSTRSTKRRNSVKITTRKIKIVPTRPTPTTVKVTTRRRRPTTVSKQRRFRIKKERQRPKTQQKDSEPFFCWDCYSASSNCRDVVNSPYSYYVGRTPCPFTRKCFVRKDNGVIYRGCADGWTSSLIESNYNGCKVQFTWGRPVEWCFCDSTLCNGNSLKHIKDRYKSHDTQNTIPSRDRKGHGQRRSEDNKPVRGSLR